MTTASAIQFLLHFLPCILFFQLFCLPVLHYLPYRFYPKLHFWCNFPIHLLLLLLLLSPHLQVLIMALSLQDEDSVLQFLHGSLEQVILLHHGTKAMLQLPLSVRQHFDLQRNESWSLTPCFPGSAEEGNHISMRAMKQKKKQKVCMHIYRTCVCERKCISVCGLTLRKGLNGYFFPTLQRQFQRVSLCIGRPRSWQECPKG